LQGDEFLVEAGMLYLMSIRPQYARAIFQGRKKFELRKLSGVPPVDEGSVIVVYSTKPEQRIIGEFRAGSVVRGSPERVWALVSGPGSGLGRDAYGYIRGGRRAMAIEVLEPRLYPRPVTLEEMRRIIPGWQPPFSYRRLSPGDREYELVIRRLRATLD